MSSFDSLDSIAVVRVQPLQLECLAISGDLRGQLAILIADPAILRAVGARRQRGIPRPRQRLGGAIMHLGLGIRIAAIAAGRDHPAGHVLPPGDIKRTCHWLAAGRKTRSVSQLTQRDSILQQTRSWQAGKKFSLKKKHQKR